MEWVVIGISGATCSGKTTLARKLHKDLKNSILIEQDTYFLPVDDSRHTWDKELNHINFDILSSLDMTKMNSDILKILNEKTHERVALPTGEKHVLIVEGFLIFDHKPITDLCTLRYFLTLDQEECYNRRQLRVYDPPDGPGYFEKIVWPEYIKHKETIMNNKNLLKSIKFYDESHSQDKVYKEVLHDIQLQMSINN